MNQSQLASAALFFCSTTFVTDAAALPVFTIAYGKNTTNAPYDLSLSGNETLSDGFSQTFNDPYGNAGATVNGMTSAGPGRLAVSNSVSVTAPFLAVRPEVNASFSGDIYFCASGSNITAAPAGGAFDPTQCLAPQGAVPIPYPNIGVTGSYSIHQASSFGVQILVSMAGVTLGSLSSNINLSNGDQSGTLTGMISTTPLGPAQVHVLPVKVSVATLAGCNRPGCSVSIDLSNTIQFIEGSDAFSGIAPGISIWSPDLNIWNNRWYSPETLAALQNPPPVGVPLPGTLSLVAGVLAGMGVRKHCSN